MSLLADLLARIKQPASKRDVPPNLRSIVQASTRRSGNRKKIILLACIFGAAVLSGLVLTHFGRSLMETDSSIIMPAGNDTAKAGMQTQQDNEAPAAASVPESSGVRGETLVSAASVRKDIENPVPEEPVTVADTADEKPVHTAQLNEEQKKPPVEQTVVSKTAETRSLSRQEPAPQTDAFLYAARKYEMNNEYLKALSSYKQVLKADANNVTVMNNIAFMYLMLNLPDEAIAYAQMALDHNSDYVPALINMAIAHARSGNYADAGRSLNHADDLDPDNETILLNLAVLNERQENFPEALELYSHLAKLGNSEGLMGEARICEKQGNTQKAVELYKGISLSESVENAVKIQARKRLIILMNKR